jgi:hypothetical protein
LTSAFHPTRRVDRIAKPSLDKILYNNNSKDKSKDNSKDKSKDKSKNYSKNYTER